MKSGFKTFMQTFGKNDRKTQFRRLLWISLTATLILAGGLRFVGLGFGRVVLDARPDEELIRSAALNSLSGDLNPHYAVWGHLFHYLYVFAGAIYLGLQVLTGLHPSWSDALAAAHCDPSTFETIGRAISATAGTLTLVATYRLARRTLNSRLSAICSCILLSTVFLHVRDSHFCTSDLLMTLNITAALAVLSCRSRVRAGWGGFWTGLALASKLLAVTVVVTLITLLCLQRFKKSTIACKDRPVRTLIIFLIVTGVTVLVLQPFLVLDPMETYFGLRGDLFNPERHPFEHGLNAVNVSIIVRYYVPQAVGWLVGGLAVTGAIHLVFRGRSGRRWVLIVFALWSLLALLSVQRIFLRYLDPLLPIASVFAGHAVAAAGRWVATGRRRVIFCLLASAGAATPNLLRDLWLDHRLLQPDTRALASQWIETNVPAESRILWSGFGTTPPHLTMPRLFTPDSHDLRLLEMRSNRGLSNEVDRAIGRWKDEHAVPRFSLIALSTGINQPELSTLDAFPMVDRDYDIAWLRALDRWSRQAGWLKRETTRVELVQRHVTATISLELSALSDREEAYLVITGMPADPAVLAAITQDFEEVKTFSPGPIASAMYKQGDYDQGDAWFLPNLGIHRVQRGGIEIHILRRRSK